MLYTADQLIAFENYDTQVKRWVNREAGHPGEPPCGYKEYYCPLHPTASLPTDFLWVADEYNRHVVGECLACCKSVHKLKADCNQGVVGGGDVCLLSGSFSEILALPTKLMDRFQEIKNADRNRDWFLKSPAQFPAYGGGMAGMGNLGPYRGGVGFRATARRAVRNTRTSGKRGRKTNAKKSRGKQAVEGIVAGARDKAAGHIAKGKVVNGQANREEREQTPLPLDLEGLTLVEEDIHMGNYGGYDGDDEDDGAAGASAATVWPEAEAIAPV
ncbi:hypothetical protein B0H11DRAFT_1918224 [Mycena galericulata]|nr:hypothetical protein B0H11DRAFT_1918224 [Mycena galericulata]